MAEIQRFCPYCGHPIDASDEYCPYCGRKTSDFDVGKMTGEGKMKKEKKSTFSVDSRSIQQNSVAALVLGIAAFVVPYGGLICAILAIILGSKYRKDNSYAKAGFILGIISVVFVVLYIIFTIALLVLNFLHSARYPSTQDSSQVQLTMSLLRQIMMR